MRGETIKVIQSVTNWLPLTMNWIFNQIKYTESVQSVVYTMATSNLDIFPFASLYQANQFEAFTHKWSYKLGLNYRHTPTIFDENTTRYNPVVLHSHFGDRGWYDLPLVKKYGLKHIVTFYGYDISMLPAKRPVWRRRYQELFEQADLFLCEGPFMAKTLVQLGCPPSKVRVHHLGVEVDRIKYIPRVFDGDPLKILIAGTFREKKGIPYAVEAVGRLKEHYQNLQLTIIGDASGRRDRQEKKKIEAMLKQYQLNSITKMLGFQSYETLLAEAYKHHIFLSPSVTANNGDTEGGAPVVLIDILASGMPIISTRHCDIPQVVQDNVAGLLADERNVTELVDHLLWFIEHPDKWHFFTDRGRKLVEQEFNVKRQSELLGDIYQAVVRNAVY